jgi:hypothetical protein
VSRPLRVPGGRAVGTIVDDHIAGNRFEPIRVDEGASPHVERNTFD